MYMNQFMYRSSHTESLQQHLWFERLQSRWEIHVIDICTVSKARDSSPGVCECDSYNA